MPRYRIAFTPNARAELRRAVAWWREHRPENPYLVEEELAEAGSLLQGSPFMGVEHVQPGITGVRKVFLPVTQHIVFHRVDEAKRVVRVVSFWHTSRGKPPPLK